MFQILLGIVVALVAAGGGWLMDVRLTRSRGSLRAIFSLALAAATAGLGAVIVAEPWLWDAAVPSEALWMFRMRVLAISTVLVTVAALFLPRAVPRWRLCLVPVLALVFFALAIHLVGTHQFMPTA